MTMKFKMYSATQQRNDGTYVSNLSYANNRHDLVSIVRTDTGKDQQQQIQTSFYQLNLNAPANGLSQEATADAKTSTDFADAAIELQKSQLEQKIDALSIILTPEQLKTYTDEQTTRINTQASAMKMFLPQKTASTSN